jgi:hypothetical protein
MEKKKKRRSIRGWRRKKERKKEKRKKEKRENMLRVYRRRIEKNEKSWYFESCEKINKIIRIY